MEHNMSFFHMISQPAFLASAGKIFQKNNAAEKLPLEVGQEIMPFLISGKVEFQNFRSGDLFLTLQIGDQQVQAHVTNQGEYQLFLLDSAETLPEFTALSRAAAKLRDPMSGLLMAEEEMRELLSSEDNPQIQEKLAAMNHRIHQMLRMVSNMADIPRYSQSTLDYRRLMNLTSVFSEIMQQAQPGMEAAGFRLELKLPNKNYLALLDYEKLERAIYNMLSNAAKYAPKGSSISVSLNIEDGMANITVENPCSQAAEIRFKQYSQEPCPTDYAQGLGLGMTLVCLAAKAHRGTVLALQEEQRVRVSFCFPLTHSENTIVRSPRLAVDYSGERPHELQELADILPNSYYY